MELTLQKVYADFRDKKGAHELAQALLEQMDWFYSVAEFDPKTGAALPQALSDVLAKLAKYSPPIAGRPIRDRLWRIAEHSRASVDRLLHALSESPRREQALLPVRAVRELDANSFIKLSNRPGRNIREKLAGKPYLQAVRRFQSVNVPENRLLKAFVTRIAELLELRLQCLGVEEDTFLPRINSWLRSEEVQAIASWDNLPPNNTLLAHRDYRRVWDAWRWLQTLDDDISRDVSELEARGGTMRLWNERARLWAEGGYLFAEMPVRFDYEKFELLPWLPQIVVQKAQRKVARGPTENEIFEPVCVDLTVLHPSFATATDSFQPLRDTYLWQHWENDDESVDIELFNSDAAYLHPEAITISIENLFFSSDKSSEHIDRSARTFASRLRNVFKSDRFIWLVPDALSDFELEVIRRNLNARFPDSEPLPRAVAAAFEKVDYAKIKNDGFPIVVVDSIGGKICITKLIARLDPILKERLPETHGFYWERCPPIVITGTNFNSPEDKGYDFVTVDDKEQWLDAVQPVVPQFPDPSSLAGDSRIGQFACCIILTESPVVGGVRFNSLRKRGGDVLLWRDQVPELSIKVMKDGCYQRFHLVSRGTTVKPIRGLSVPIPVEENFTLPSGRPFYQFPLFQGEFADKLGFSARLESPVFPLGKDAVCKLNLTFEYGADEPYKLVFISAENSFAPLRATWQRTEEAIITDAPAPEYPSPMTWADLRNWQKRDSAETSDLLEWVLRAIHQVENELSRTTGEITEDWREDKNGHLFTSVRCRDSEIVVRIYAANFVKNQPYRDFKKGDKVSFELHARGEMYSGKKVAGHKYDVLESIKKGLRFPTIQIWRDGRSIANRDCPAEFAEEMGKAIKYLVGLLQRTEVPSRIKQEVSFLLTVMHKDSPSECVQWVTEQVKNGTIYAQQAVGFALGDVSEQWQKDIFAKLVTRLTSSSLRVFAYAIWREPHFVEKFNLTELSSILKVLVATLGEIKECSRRKNEDYEKTGRIWGRTTSEPLELLLGLLRTRASSDSEIKMLLQPRQKVTRDLANQVERIAEIVARSSVPLSSRVQISIQRPDGDRRTPDLLYALRLYLTGDDGANAIHITSVSDTDND